MGFTSKNRPNTSFMARRAAGHAPRSRQELTAAHAELLGRAGGELERPSLDALLLVGLSCGHVLAVRDDLGGDRHPVHIGHVGGGALRQLLVTQPRILLT